MKTTIMKMTCWKLPDSDCVQGYCFKRFSTLHSKLTEHLQACVVSGRCTNMDGKGKTTLIQKDPENENVANNYHPIDCQQLPSYHPI